MTKLSPAQQRILKAAAKQPQSDVREHMKDIKSPAARDKVVESLIKRGLIAEDPDANGVVYIISPEGFAAIGKKPSSASAAKPKKGESAAQPAKKKQAGEKPARATKGGMIIDMLRKGTTVKKMMEATGWQSHSVRGFLSNLRTKQNVEINATLDKDGEKVFRLA